MELSTSPSGESQNPQERGGDALVASHAVRRLFRPLILDDSPQLLELSYRLRYQSYCLERGFLPAEDYPSQLESDTFDQGSIHVGVLNLEDELVGTARLVKPGSAGLPLLRYCVLFPEETALSNPANTVVELSRVCISRRLSRRQSDVFFAGPEPEKVAPPDHMIHARDRRHDPNDPFAMLAKGVYQATKRHHATHWIIAVEKALRRRLQQYGLPFRLAGPEVDYYGPVTPYLMSLADLDEVILSRQFAAHDDFTGGLEPEFWPTPHTKP